MTAATLKILFEGYPWNIHLIQVEDCRLQVEHNQNHQLTMRHRKPFLLLSTVSRCHYKAFPMSNTLPITILLIHEQPAAKSGVRKLTQRGISEGNCEVTHSVDCLWRKLHPRKQVAGVYGMLKSIVFLVFNSRIYHWTRTNGNLL